MKKCPKCGRTSPPALVACPRCKTPFRAPLGQESIRQTSSSRQPDTGSGMSRRTVIAISVVAVIVIAALTAAYFFSAEISTNSRMLVQKVQGKEWKYPPGDEAETARIMSAQQLIEAWETVPGKSQTSLHATYARALGLKGREAVSAVAVLSPYVLDKDLYLRQGAMAGLAGIGEEGLPYLVKALKYPDSKGGDAATIRWDAAMAMAKMGIKAKGAMQDLLSSITDPNENPNVKGDAATALAGIGLDAIPALNKARCFFYAQGGLSPSEVGVLRTINISLRQMNAPEEDCNKPLSSQSPEAQSAPAPTPGKLLRPDDLGRMQVPQLLEALRSHPYNTREITDELVRKGAKDQAAEILTSMLKDRNRTTDLGIKMALGKIGAPVTYDKNRNVFLPVAEDNIGHIDFSAEVRGDAIYSSGRIYVGQDVYAGLSRQQTGPMKVPAFVRYTITIKGGSLGSPVEKTFDVSSAGEHAWDNIMLASGLGQGKYNVSLFLHAQFTKQDGSGMILNNNAGFLEVER